MHLMQYLPADGVPGWTVLPSKLTVTLRYSLNLDGIYVQSLTAYRALECVGR